MVRLGSVAFAPLGGDAFAHRSRRIAIHERPQLLGNAAPVGGRFELAEDRKQAQIDALHDRVVRGHVRVLGDAVYNQDSWVPQVSVGAQYKKASEGDLLNALGAENDSGVDFYVSGTKVLLDKSLILGGTLRGTKANQFGLLGFGGDLNGDYSLEVEATAAYMVSKNVVIGADYRSKPNNLGFAEEDDSAAAYIAFFPSKNLSVTAAYVDAGKVALQGKQSGAYGSLQIGF